jgi:hypothetical protein
MENAVALGCMDGHLKLKGLWPSTGTLGFKVRKINYLFPESLYILYSRVSSFGIVTRLGPRQFGVRIWADERDFPAIQKKKRSAVVRLAPYPLRSGIFPSG